jgi:hypothetical protein
MTATKGNPESHPYGKPARYGEQELQRILNEALDKLNCSAQISANDPKAKTKKVELSGYCKQNRRCH